MIRNPILTGFNPDPSICRVADDYYIATSTFEWFPGVQIHHSKDMVNWRLLTHPLTRISQLDMLGNPDSSGVWAPALSYADGQFWLIYSDMKVGNGASWLYGRNYLVTSKTIEGPWSEPIYLNSSGFDPSLFHSPDGKKFLVNMVWDQRPSNTGFYGISLQEYSHEMQQLIGTPQVIFKGSSIGMVEAPHLYYKNNYYYLLTAEGGTWYEHAATIARSRTLEGPYEVHPENPLISSWKHPDNPLQKAGHGSFVETQNGEWYMPYLMGRPIKADSERNERGYCPLGRETSIQKIEWKEDDWPYVVGGNQPSQTVQAPDLPAVTWPASHKVVDHFDAKTLNLNFQTLRIPFTEEMGSLAERPGYLRLYGWDPLQSEFQQAHVARRWQSLTFNAETKINFQPTTFQQQAGLSCYYNTSNWVTCHVTFHEQYGRVIDLMEVDNFSAKQPLGEAVVPIPDEVTEVFFKVEVRELEYQFYFAFNQTEWQPIGEPFETYKLSDDYFVAPKSNFTGAFVGLYATDTLGVRLPADFDYFKYEEL